MKTIKKLLIVFAIMIAVSVLAAFSITAPAFADDGTTEAVTVIDENASLESVVNRFLVPIVGGSAASAIAIGLAIAIPYIKKSNAYKTAVLAFNTTKSELGDAKKIIAELKEQAKNTDINAIVNKVTTATSTAVIDKIGEIVKAEMDKRVDQTTSIFTNVNTISAQLASLISAANVTWGNVDGVAQILSKSPTAATLAALAEENTKLKKVLTESQGITQDDLKKILEA